MPKDKPTEFRVEFDEGLVQIRRLLPKAIELPVWVINWIVSHKKELEDFINENESLLAMPGDPEGILESKLLTRKQILNAGFKSVVRKPREKNSKPEILW